MLENHLSYILIQYAQQETTDLKKLRTDLDTFIEKSTQLGITLNGEEVIKKANLLCTKQKIKHRLEEIKKPSASPTSSPEKIARGEFDASLFLLPFLPTRSSDI